MARKIKPDHHGREKKTDSGSLWLISNRPQSSPPPCKACWDSLLASGTTEQRVTYSWNKEQQSKAEESLGGFFFNPLEFMLPCWGRPLWWIQIRTSPSPGGPTTLPSNSRGCPPGLPCYQPRPCCLSSTSPVSYVCCWGYGWFSQCTPYRK